jgi:hypothetical protein
MLSCLWVSLYLVSPSLSGSLHLSLTRSVLTRTLSISMTVSVYIPLCPLSLCHRGGARAVLAGDGMTEEALYPLQREALS